MTHNFYTDRGEGNLLSPPSDHDDMPRAERLRVAPHALTDEQIEAIERAERLLQERYDRLYPVGCNDAPPRTRRTDR
jgi:hypothetical protein